MLAPTVKYHYSDRFSTYSVMRGREPPLSGECLLFFAYKRQWLSEVALRPVPRTESDGEFDWGGTSVK